LKLVPLCKPRREAADIELPQHLREMLRRGGDRIEPVHRRDGVESGEALPSAGSVIGPSALSQRLCATTHAPEGRHR
jgi:hypothetical protein